MPSDKPRPIMMCLNNAIDTITRYVPIGKSLFPDRRRILDREAFNASLRPATIERLRIYGFEKCVDEFPTEEE